MDAVILFQAGAAADSSALPIVKNACTGQLEHEKFAVLVQDVCRRTLERQFSWKSTYTHIERMTATPSTPAFTRTILIRAQRGSDTNRRVVVKIKRVAPDSRRADTEFMENMFEVHFLEMLCRASHPNLVRLLGVWAYQKTREVFIELEDAGAPLTNVLARYEGRVPEPLIAWYMRQGLAGLAYVHSRAVVHCDVKADNLLVRPDGSLRLADFGMAQECGEPFGPIPWNPNAINPRGYLPYELLTPRRHVTCAVDLYALGCVFVSALCGPPVPFAAIDPAAQMAALPQFSPGVPGTSAPCRGLAFFNGLHPAPALENLLLRLLHWNPDRRIVAAVAEQHEFFFCMPRPDSEMFK